MYVTVCLIQTELQPNPTTRRRRKFFGRYSFWYLQQNDNNLVILVIPGFRKKVSINHLRNVKFKDIKEEISIIANFVGVVESDRKILFAVRNSSQLAYTMASGAELQ